LAADESEGQSAPVSVIAVSGNAFDELVSARFKLDELDQAWSAFRCGGGARSVIVFE
jgi:Zn-dependent alcohol dehydrogenase